MQASLMEDNNLSFLTGASSLSNRPARDRSESPIHDPHIRSVSESELARIAITASSCRSPINGGLHIKQENILNPDHHHVSRETEQMHHVIKREVHSEYDDMEQEQHTENMAEDLTIPSEHAESNILDA
jgi:hypothetical protein